MSSVLYGAKKAYGLGTKVIPNPAPAQKLPGELFEFLYMVTPNETEAEILTGIKVEDAHSASKAAGILLQAGVQNVIITLGAQGAFFKNDKIELLVKAPLVKAVDTTGAGDVFNGVLAVEIILGKNGKKRLPLHAWRLLSRLQKWEPSLQCPIWPSWKIFILKLRRGVSLLISPSRCSVSGVYTFATTFKSQFN